MTDKIIGTCSVCLRGMQLRGDRPIRHGFAAKNVQHGQHTGYHTGPCPGVNFPHLGISDEGTRWAIDDAHQRLVNTNNSLAHLATNPDLIWYPRKTAVRGADLPRGVTLRYGADDLSATDGRPSYARWHRSEVALLEATKRALEDAITKYEHVIAGWAPEKYPTSGAKTKQETIHMALERKINDKVMTGTCCLGVRRGHRAGLTAKTTDPAKVTCKRCRTALGLPST